MTQVLPEPLRRVTQPAWWPPTPSETAPNRQSWPRITVITPSFNQADFLESTLRSVLSQGYPNLEYIVVDGGSRDGSVEIIRHYAAHLAWWVSEPDAGQTDAILKGLQRATGDWINWINSDDLLAPGALWRIAQAAQGADMVAGSVVNFSADKQRGVVKCRRFTMQSMIFQHLGGGTKYHQPGIWLRREALLRTGIARNRHYKFDYEMLLRYLHRYPSVHYLPDVLAYFRLHENSKTITQTGSRLNAFQSEHVEILQELARDPEFATYRNVLELAARQCAWIVELSRFSGEQKPRRQELTQLWREVRADPPARCIRHSRKVALRLLRRGLWPQRWSKAVREKL